MNARTFLISSLVLGFGLVADESARAQYILQPVSATTNMGSAVPIFPPTLTINQSGLSTGYTNFSATFTSYIASNPTHASSNAFNSWISEQGNPVGFFDFDLGSIYPVKSYALWNYGGFNGQNIQLFDLLLDDNPEFSSPTSFGFFQANPNTGPSTAVLPEVFSFNTTLARYVRMEILGNWNNPDNTAFGEAAFEVAAVPEPTTWALMILGVGAAAGGGWYYRRQRAKLLEQTVRVR